MTSYSLGIVGSRHFNNFRLFQSVLWRFRLLDDQFYRIVSGGAVGTDRLAKRYALLYRYPIKEYYPDWAKYGKAAGPIRNKLIVNDSDVLLAFWDYESRGTKSSIDFAKSLHKKVHIFDIRKEL